MAITVASVVASVQQHFADIPQGLCLSLLNDVHNDILENVRLTPDTSVQVTLTAGTQEYPLPDSVLRIWDADYSSGSGNHCPLTQTSVDELDYRHQGWRTEQPGIPNLIYDRGGMVGFYPCPNVSTTSGYPIVTLYVSQLSSPLAIGDSLPGPARTANAWVYAVCARFSAMLHQDQYPMFSSLAKVEYERLLEYTYGRLARDKASIMPRISPIRTI